MTNVQIYKTFLRPMERPDWQELQKLAGTQAVARMTGSINAPWSDEDAQKWVNLRVSSQVFPKTFIIEIKNEVIGLVGVGGRPISMMYLIDQAHWGKGFASEAVQKTLGYTFQHSDTDEIVADVFQDNPASIRILEKFGFKCIGEDVDTSLVRVEPAPVFLYRLTRTDFEGLNT